jgi:hypothetical protein
MRKLSTGEPYAGKLHVRFGGRGEFFPTPIRPKSVNYFYMYMKHAENSMIMVLSANLEKDSNKNYSAFFTTIRSYFKEDAEDFLRLNDYDG